MILNTILTTFKELDTVVITTEISSDQIWDVPPSSSLKKLKKGSVGIIVYVQNNGDAFEVEFTDLNGDTIALATVLESQMRRLER